MHELSLAESIAEIIEREAGAEKALASVTLTVGPLAGVCTESLRFCFADVAREHGFGEPELIINETPVRLRCEGCGREYAVEHVVEPCPHCGGLRRKVLSGDEFTLDAVEVEG